MWEHVAASCLPSETIEGTSLSLERVHYVERGDGASFGVFGVGDRVTNDRFEEELEDTTRLVVDETRDTLDTSTSRKTSDSGLGDTLNVVAQNLAVSLGTTLAEALATFTASRH